MNLIFAGTPEFAAHALSALLAAGHQIPLVLTQPDRPAGRGMKLIAPPVKALALQHGLRVEQPVSLKSDAVQAMLREAVRARAIDAMIVAAYGLILPQAVLDLPPRGCLNIHASLLPRWRGAAPIQRAIQAGDLETGIGIMQMEAGLDTGPVLYETRLPILDRDTGASLHDRLTVLGGQTIVAALREIDSLTPRAQPATGVTYAHKLDKSESRLDFSRPAAELDRQIRAFDPYPGSTALLGHDQCKVWSAQVLADPAVPAVAGTARPLPGVILAVGNQGIDVACGSGVLRITKLQKPGGRRLSVREFLARTPLAVGDFFAPAAA